MVFGCPISLGEHVGRRTLQKLPRKISFFSHFENISTGKEDGRKEKGRRDKEQGRKRKKEERERI